MTRIHSAIKRTRYISCERVEELRLPDISGNGDTVHAGVDVVAKESCVAVLANNSERRPDRGKDG